MKASALTILFSIALCVVYYAATLWDFFFNHAQFRRDLDSIND